MSRKLLLANLLLLALASAGVWHLRDAWKSEKSREQAVLGKGIRRLAPPPAEPQPAAAPVRASEYIDIAQKDLFTRDRNPNIVVETKPPEVKPMPPLPLFHGVLNLGDGPLAILSEKKGAPHRDFRPGESIGEFKLVAVNNGEIVLEWDGKEIHKRLDEIDRSAPPPAQVAAADQSRSEPAPRGPSGKAEPGVEIGKGMHACQPGDTSPAGTVAGGLRKRAEASPFGQRCWWEPVP